MTDVDSLWAAAAANPADDTVKLALADALAEAGDFDVAATVAWCVSQRRWPKRTWGQQWTWTSGKTGAVPKKQTHVLPSPFYEQLKRVRWSAAFASDYDRYHSCRGQVELLTAVFVDLRDRGPKWLR